MIEADWLGSHIALLISHALESVDMYKYNPVRTKASCH